MHMIDERFYINVKDLMKNPLPRPTHTTSIIINYDELLPIITLEAEV